MHSYALCRSYDPRGQHNHQRQPRLHLYPQQIYGGLYLFEPTFRGDAYGPLMPPLASRSAALHERVGLPKVDIAEGRNVASMDAGMRL